MKIVPVVPRTRIDVDLATKRAVIFLAYSTGLTQMELVAAAVREYVARRYPEGEEVMLVDEGIEEEASLRAPKQRAFGVLFDPPAGGSASDDQE